MHAFSCAASSTRENKKYASKDLNLCMNLLSDVITLVIPAMAGILTSCSGSEERVTRPGRILLPISDVDEVVLAQLNVNAVNTLDAKVL